MKKQNLFFFSMLMGILFMSGGCGHVYYVSSTQNVPMFREKNELHTSGGIAGTDETTGWEANIAYSVTNHIGIMANYMTAKGGSVEDRDFGRGTYMDVAAGYYTPINRLTTLEVYGGIGHCKQYHELSYYTGDYNGAAKVRFGKIFLQAAYGLCFDNFNVIGSVRLNQVSFYNLRTSPDADQYVHEEMDELKGQLHYILEPALTVRGGWKYMKAQFQISYVEYLNNDESYFVDPYHAGFSLYFTIAPRYWKDGK